MPVRSAVLALLFLSLTGCGASGGLLGEAGELFSEGGSKTLRTPLRPIRGTTRVLVIGLDGVGNAVLRDALEQGAMPRLAAFLGPSEGDVWRNAYAVSGAPSVFPAETAAGWAAVFTGRPQAENGVAGNEWFDRDSVEVYAPVPLSVGTIKQTLQIYTDNLLGEIIEVPTVFERADVRSHVSMGFVYRGADLMNPPDLQDLPDLLGVALRFITGGDAQKAAFRALDSDTWGGVKRSASQDGLPDLQVAYFPGIDLETHRDGPEAQYTYLTEVIDRRIAQILDLYRAEGVLDDTYVLLVSDHGHTPTLDDDRHSLDSGAPGEPPDLFESVGVRLRPFEIGADTTGDFQAVMTYDEAVAMVYLADRSTCPSPGDVCDWSRPARLDEDVLPVARAFAEAHATGAHAAGLDGALDLVLARVSRPANGTAPPFRVLDGDRLVPVADFLAAHDRDDLFDLERRLGWLTDGPLGHRGGDVLVLAKAGLERPLDQRFYFGAPRHSGHGGASRSDGEITFVLAQAGTLGSTLQAKTYEAVGARPTQLDIADLILALLAEGER